MKNFYQNGIGFVLIMILMLGFTLPNIAQAAVTPDLGGAATYGVLSSTYTNPTGPTTITGDVGFTTGPAVVPLGVHTNYGSDAPYSAAGISQGAAWTNLNTQYLASCTSLGAGAVNLNNVAGHVTGIYTPGCYSSGGAMNITTGATVTLNGAGTYIFRPNGALTTEANTFVEVTGGASVCDVFWIPTAATTLGAVTAFKGTVIDDAGITIGDTVTWVGRALSFATTVTTPNTNATITVPTGCTGNTLPTSGNNFNIITVVKQVINDSGGTATYSDFPLFLNGNHVISGQSLLLAPGIYTLTETNLPGYETTFSGNCDANGVINHGGVGTHNDFCTIVNNDIGVPAVAPVPPLIDIVKVPSPLALPAGPGLVTYTYTTKNIGTVPMTNVTLVGDTCSPIILNSGDTNEDSKLNINETWVYKCSTTLSTTHTNTVVATGWANGISAVDSASATVVVGLPVVPPLIHVVKTPYPLILPIGAGIVTYNYTVTNPGTVPLSNVSITDDKCTGLPGRVLGHPGDLNKNNLLESNESWSFTCKTNLIKTTTNTAIATGSANGLIATDFALATVVVAVPKLPKTGFPPLENNISLIVISILFILTLSLITVNLKRQKIQ